MVCPCDDKATMHGIVNDSVFENQGAVSDLAMAILHIYKTGASLCFICIFK